MAASTRSGGRGRNGASKSNPGESRKNKKTDAKLAAAGNAADTASRRDVAEYIAAMLESMRLLAHQKDLAFLSYLIGIALEEANSEMSKRD